MNQILIYLFMILPHPLSSFLISSLKVDGASIDYIMSRNIFDPDRGQVQEVEEPRIEEFYLIGTYKKTKDGHFTALVSWFEKDDSGTEIERTRYLHTTDLFFQYIVTHITKNSIDLLSIDGEREHIETFDGRRKKKVAQVEKIYSRYWADKI